MKGYKFYVGCDLGEIQDYSAISVIERAINYHKDKNVFISNYSVRELIRFPLQTPYTTVVEKMKLIFKDPYIETYGSLIVDKTGLGRPVIEMMHQEGLSPIGVTITGGHVVSKEPYGFNVPKSELISAFLIMAQTGQFKISRKLKLAEQFRKELESFKVKMNRKTGYETYEGEKEHDDLIICVALALWYAHRFDPQIQTLDQMADNQSDEEVNKAYNYLTGSLGENQ